MEDPVGCGTIIQDRYGIGWVAWNCDPEDIPDSGHNCGDAEHWEFHQAHHRHPMGWGATPDDALDSLRVEILRFRAEGDTYRCCLDEIRRRRQRQK